VWLCNPLKNLSSTPICLCFSQFELPRPSKSLTGTPINFKCVARIVQRLALLFLKAGEMKKKKKLKRKTNRQRQKCKDKLRTDDSPPSCQSERSGVQNMQNSSGERKDWGTLEPIYRSPKTRNSRPSSVVFSFCWLWHLGHIFCLSQRTQYCQPMKIPAHSFHAHPHQYFDWPK